MNEDQRTALQKAFDSMITLLQEEFENGRFSIYRMFPVASLVLGDHVQVGNASRYIYYYARSQGYDIPPYPLSSSGEIRTFFADEGVTNVPEWYAKIGMSQEEYERIHEYTIVAVRGQHADRTAFLIDLYMRNWPQFTRLVESDIASYLTANQMTHLLEAVLGAALDDLQTQSVNPTIRIVRLTP